MAKAKKNQDTADVTDSSAPVVEAEADGMVTLTREETKALLATKRTQARKEKLALMTPEEMESYQQSRRLKAKARREKRKEALDVLKKENEGLKSQIEILRTELGVLRQVNRE